MARYMITHTLLSSWLYAMKSNPYEDSTSERDPFGDFLRTLRREPTERTEDMQNGIDFEDLVTDILHGRGDPNNKWFDAAWQVAEEIHGHQLQFKAGKTIVVNGMEIFLYGRLDALGGGVITDIKFSKNYERGKYFDSTQHPMYFELVPGAKTFIYTISNGRTVLHETYRRDEARSIIPTVAAFLDWLTAAGYMEEFKKRWEAAA